jgi:GLPGLI family protein
MKLFLAIFLLCYSGKILKSQTIEVHYDVKDVRQIPVGEGKTKEFILDFEGIIYQKGDSTIIFLKPMYLLDYPTGNISIQTGENSMSMMPLNMDTMQRISLYYANLEKYWSYNRQSKEQFTVNIKQWPMQWKLIAETKEINGLQCKRAVTYNGGDTTNILYDIWYYSEVAMSFGLLDLKNAPGLIVQCFFPMMNISYTLKYLKKGEPINDAVFWPTAFNKVIFEDYSKPQKVSEKEKKKDAIMGSNN